MIDSEMAVALWTLFHDKEFLHQYHNEIDPQLIPRGAARYLSALAIQHWRSDKALLTVAAMDIVLSEADAQRFGTTYDAAVDVYIDVYDRFTYDENDLPIFRAAAVKWFRSLRISQHLDDATEALEAGDLDAADKALRESHRSLSPAQRGKNLRDDLRNTIAKSWPPSCPTGFEVLDKAWYGGLHLGQLGTVIAPWNTGKSMILPWFAGQALKANKNVLYYTTELDEDTVLKRTASSIVRKPINTMDADEASEGIRRMFAMRQGMAGSEEEDAPEPWFEVMYRDALSLSVRDIEADLDMLKEEGHRIHLIIMDGDDIKCEQKFDRGYDMFLYIYTDLASLAVRRKVAIWTAAQGNKDSAKANVIVGQHLADSIAKIRKADLALGMQHKSDFIDADSMRPFMRINIAKDRFFGTRDKMITPPMFFGEGINGYAAFGPTTEWYEDEREKYK